jgi:protein TonB
MLQSIPISQVWFFNLYLLNIRTMKKSIQLFMVICFLLSQGCSTKPKEQQATPKEQADAEIAKKREELVAKRARIEKARLEREEQRRLAYEAAVTAGPTYRDKDGKLVYIKAEVSPSYVGGDEAIAKYLKDNLVYPKVALDKGVEGTVFVDFVVLENGEVSGVSATDAVWEDVDQSLMDEAARIVSTMPNWVAGRQHGKAVSTKFSIPITFQLSD